ncbi:MAG: 4-diphosphocytidyl-2C-methyl-D-erythritol synthase [Alphaproteobacteria bacterium MedPE-SWcel]|nr:MAG: 4-diphosphocytidyl-2C-methyl-D-erythritol synthase [Alphaproteobacteria bacterium MedPE-SWcel]
MQGRDKLMEDVDGQPLLAHLVHQARATDLPVYVTLPGPAHPRARAATGATAVPVHDAAEGMSASIRAGLRVLPDTVRGALLLPADMPELTTADFQQMAARFQGENGPILRASGADETGTLRPGHPVLFPKRCFAALQKLRGDTGARALLQDDRVEMVPLPGARALTDLDTPEAWAHWRHHRK